MNKLRKREVFSILHTPNRTDAPLPPHRGGHTLFRELRPHLLRQPWDPQRSYTASSDQSFTRQEFSRRETAIEIGGQITNLAWVIDGPPELTVLDQPDDSDRVEERLDVHSDDWRHQASLRFTRNVLNIGVIDMDAGIRHAPVLSDLRFVIIAVEATAPNETDRLRVAFGASAFFPEGCRAEYSRVINGAPAVLDTIVDKSDLDDIPIRHERMHPGPDDIAALRESVAMLQNTLAYLRRTPLS